MVPEGWTTQSVGDLCNFVNGNGFKSSEWSTEGLPIIRIQNLNGSSDFNYFSGIPKKSWIVNKGDILFAWAGTKGVSFGAKLWNGPKGVLNQHIFRVEAKCGLDLHWLYLALLKVTQKVEEKAHGFKSTLVHVQKSDITEQVLPVPPLSEQKKIAQILAAWDKSISKTEQLLDNSRLQKKALVQQLLSGNRRLLKKDKENGFKKTTFGYIPADWEYPKIGDICSQVSEKNTSGADYPVLSCTKREGFVDSLKYFKKRVYSEDTSGYRLIPMDCFGYPANHIEEGSIGLQRAYDVGLVSPIYVVFMADQEKVNNEYLYTLLKTEHYRQIFSSATNSSVDRRGSLRWKEFSSIHVPLPPLSEQNKIASMLVTIDKEIENLKNTINHLKQEKKALMQQLLTGKRRVKTEDKEK